MVQPLGNQNLTKTLAWNSDNEREFWAAKCRSSFWWFVLYAFGAHFNPEGSFIYPPVHKKLCDWAQAHVEHWWKARQDPRTAYRLHLAILVPRRVGKTTIMGQAFPLWLNLWNPDLATRIGSAKDDDAMDILSSVKAVMEGESPYAKFTDLYGDWYNPSRDWSKTFLNHAARVDMSRKDPSFAVYSVNSGITGKHPDIVIIDDPTSYERLANNTNWFEVVNDHIATLGYVVENDGIFLWNGTRYGDSDHFGTYLPIDGVRSIEGMDTDMFTVDPDGLWNLFFMDIYDDDDPAIRKSTVPTQWSLKALRVEEKRHPDRFAAQMRNNPSLSTKVMIRPEDIDRMWVAEEDVLNDQANRGLVDWYGSEGMYSNSDHDDGKNGDNGPPPLQNHSEVVTKIYLFLHVLVHFYPLFSPQRRRER